MAQESYPDIIQDSGLGREKHPGLRLRRSGKWGVQIYHPIEGKVIWLGTYDTIEEAKNVYQKKKLEMAALLCRLDKHKTPICAKDSQSACKSYKGVRQKRPGRWSAEIKDPFKRKRLHLGTFNTPEEAADAYAKKRREFDDALMALGKKQQGKGEAAENSNSTVTAVSSQDSQENNCTEHAEDEFGVGVGVGVINSYGQLIGEYSRIDDDLWLTGL